MNINFEGEYREPGNGHSAFLVRKKDRMIEGICIKFPIIEFKDLDYS